jgi:hypothetical protein
MGMRLMLSSSSRLVTASLFTTNKDIVKGHYHEIKAGSKDGDETEAVLLI